MNSALRKAAFFLLLLSAASLHARQGAVETRDGKIFDGYIRFESNLLIIVNAETLLYAEVPVTNLLAATFKLDTTNKSGVWTGGAFSGNPDDNTAAKNWEANSVPHPWRAQGIGLAVRGGNASFSAGLFRVETATTGINSDSDSFHYIYKPIHGNSEIVARIIQVQRTDPSATAGLMMRESLAADSPNVFLGLNASGGGVFQWREGRQEETAQKKRRDLLVPCWIKLKRDGDTFTGYRSSDGRLWAGIDRVTLPLSKDIYIGLAATGLPEKGLHRAAIDNVQEGLAVSATIYPTQVELLSGSTVSARIQSLEDDGIRFASRPLQTPLPARSVANIRFQFVPARAAHKLKTGRAGMLLANGDFIDGEVVGIKDGVVTLSSTVLGYRSFDMNSEVVAIIFRKQARVSAEFEVKTDDGSVWLGNTMEIAGGYVSMREAALGVCRVPLHELAELRRKN